MFLHERTGAAALTSMAVAGRAVVDPKRVFAVMDHIVDTRIGRSDATLMPGGQAFITETRAACATAGITLFDVNDRDQGIVHVISPELGVVLPGLTLVAPDSHTCTQGAFGALAWGIGSSEAEHAMATGTLRLARPKTMRVAFTGATHELAGTEPTVVFVPHFVGMDAAWGAVALRIPRPSTTIYTDQSNKLIDRWILRGRSRWGNMRLFGRVEGVKPIVAAIRSGQPLYLLPDMDFGPQESIFVPFFGIPTATVPSLSRFARLGRAKVVPAVVSMTPSGYQVMVLPAWDNFPTDDAVQDTARMNRELESYIRSQPAQYFWVHKRFKTRPAGAPDVY